MPGPNRSAAKLVTKGAGSRVRLTRRQREVVGLVALGLTDGDIADALGLTPDMVADQVARVTRRFALTSRAQVITWANEHGLTAGQDRLLTLLEQLLDIEGTNLDEALDHAAQLTVEAFGTDKVDIFIYEPRSNSLIARGASHTPLGRLQRAIGMDIQPVVNGGRAVDVFHSGNCYLTGHADQDSCELVGVTQGLGVRSEAIVPLVVAGERRGVIAAQAEAPDTFFERDLRFLQAVSRWIAGVVHRAELLERTAAAATERGRRAAADELVMVVAHDLRNHLTPMRMRIDLIRRLSALADDAQGLKHIDGLRNSIGRLEAMIADLLDVARLEHGLFALVPRETDLVALVLETSARFGSEQNIQMVRSPERLIANVDRTESVRPSRTLSRTRSSMHRTERP
jgi:two-component system, OmpR family, sensor kinase